MAKPSRMETKSLNLQVGGTRNHSFFCAGQSVRGSSRLSQSRFSAKRFCRSWGWTVKAKTVRGSRGEKGAKSHRVSSGGRGSFHVACFHVEFLPVALAALLTLTSVLSVPWAGGLGCGSMVIVTLLLVPGRALSWKYMGTCIGRVEWATQNAKKGLYSAFILGRVLVFSLTLSLLNIWLLKRKENKNPRLELINGGAHLLAPSYFHSDTNSSVKFHEFIKL